MTQVPLPSVVPLSLPFLPSALAHLSEINASPSTSSQEFYVYFECGYPSRREMSPAAHYAALEHDSICVFSRANSRETRN